MTCFKAAPLEKKKVQMDPIAEGLWEGMRVQGRCGRGGKADDIGEIGGIGTYNRK